MKKTLMIVGGILLAGLIALGAGYAQQSGITGSIKVSDKEEAKFVEKATISRDDAINAALKQVPGKVLKVELENENGYLVYGVEIVKADKSIADVKVDAGNGKVLKIDNDSDEGEEHEGKEKREIER
ncbi:PepSY domain-containing protein [Thermodesulfovibrio yellowstonii]|uniref:Peptidase n=1 Tax=Thermodesulfovibrio yellowstonii TaxID=28262 RepID=A0A9W6LKP8_9BACT|nr:PepSY domain-containing protein [Thermodesulfovibrio islandicus]GLI53854.1 peptidase [Thermodesulfovibrio islandicus]